MNLPHTSRVIKLEPLILLARLLGFREFGRAQLHTGHKGGVSIFSKAATATYGVGTLSWVPQVGQ